MLSRQAIATKPLVSITMLPIVSTTGSIALPPMVWLAFWKENALVVPEHSLLLKNKNYPKICCFPPENSATIKTSGMVHCCPITWKNSFLRIYRLGNVKIFSITWVSPYKDLVGKGLKPIRNNRKPLKKLLSMDKKPRNRTLGRRRSPLSTGQQSYSHLGSQRRTTPGSFCCYPPEDWLFWGSQFKDWPTFDPRSFCLQHRNLPGFSFLSGQLHWQAYPSNLRPCQLPPSQGFKTFPPRAPVTSYLGFSASIFSRAQSNRASLENYPTKGNPQPLFPGDTRPSGRSYQPICSVELS